MAKMLPMGNIRMRAWQQCETVWGSCQDAPWPCQQQAALCRTRSYQPGPAAGDRAGEVTAGACRARVMCPMSAAASPRSRQGAGSGCAGRASGSWMLRRPLLSLRQLVREPGLALRWSARAAGVRATASLRRARKLPAGGLGAASGGRLEHATGVAQRIRQCARRCGVAARLGAGWKDMVRGGRGVYLAGGCLGLGS